MRHSLTGILGLLGIGTVTPGCDSESEDTRQPMELVHQRPCDGNTVMICLADGTWDSMHEEGFYCMAPHDGMPTPLHA